jgi:DNA-binding transcriptional ArsR family regulator
MPDPLSRVFGALADPTRRAMLARLAEGEATVGELAEPLTLSLPAVSKHLKVLQSAGLVSQRRDRQRRPCRIQRERLVEVQRWLARYAGEWGESFARLDLLLSQGANGGGNTHE